MFYPQLKIQASFIVRSIFFLLHFLVKSRNYIYIFFLPAIKSGLLVVVFNHLPISLQNVHTTHSHPLPTHTPPPSLDTHKGHTHKGHTHKGHTHLAGPEDDPVEVLGQRLRWVGLDPEEVGYLLHYLLPAYGDGHWPNDLVHAKEVLVFYNEDRDVCGCVCVCVRACVIRPEECQTPFV